MGRSDCVRSFGSGRCGYGRGGLHADPPLRNSNEISVFLKLVERLDSLDAETAFAGIDAFVERVRTDPAFRLQLAQRGIVDGLREIASLLQFLEHFSTLVVTERVTERLVLAEYADNIDDLWDRLAEMIYLRRAVLDQHYGAAFEHIAMRAKRYLADSEMERFYGRLKKDPRMASFVPPYADAE